MLTEVLPEGCPEEAKSAEGVGCFFVAATAPLFPFNTFAEAALDSGGTMLLCKLEGFEFPFSRKQNLVKLWKTIVFLPQQRESEEKI